MSTEKLGIWERQMVLVVEDLWSCVVLWANPVPGACSLFEEEERRKAKGAIWTQLTLLQPLAWGQLRVCFPTLHEPLAQQTGSSMMYGCFPARWLPALTGGIPISWEAPVLSMPCLERSRATFLEKASVLLGIKPKCFWFSWQQQSLQRKKGMKN